MPIATLSRTALVRAVLAAVLLAGAATADAMDKRMLAVGATVIASSQCRVEGATGARCAGGAAAPAVSSSVSTASAAASYDGALLVKVSPVSASLDSRNTVIASAERVVLTIAP
jgi:hypothetical protein